MAFTDEPAVNIKIEKIDVPEDDFESYLDGYDSTEKDFNNALNEASVIIQQINLNSIINDYAWFDLSLSTKEKK